MTEFTTLFRSEAAAAPNPAVGAKSNTSPAVAGLRIPMRPLKIGIGLTLLMAGAYGVLSDRQFLSTDSAVVTAYLTEVRTPIDGTLTGMPASAGGIVAQGVVIGAVDNQLFDQQPFINLSILERQASSGASAAAAESAALQSQEQELSDRAAAHFHAVTVRLQNQCTQEERLLAARIADLDEAKRELARGKLLHDAGILPDSEYDKLQSTTAVATAEEAAQRAAVTAVHTELKAAGSGVLSEPGTNSDVPYSQQRADEVKMRLAEVERSRAAFQAQAKEARSGADLEKARLTRMQHSELVTPVSGMLWRLNAVNGERVSTGEAVAQIVDCEQSFVLAEISQERVPDIVIGAQTRLRLMGETQERYGSVLAISGDPQLDNNQKMAAFPTRNPGRHLATVRISIDGSGKGECLVGRSATVLIAVGNGSPLARAWRRFF